MLTEEEVYQQYYNGDPFLKFGGPVNNRTPREFIPYIDVIKKESDWLKYSFVIKKDNYDNYKPIRKNGLYFGFSVLRYADTDTLRAIETCKKCTKYPSDVFLLIKQGCSYDDFAFLSKDVIAYCNSLILFELNNKEEALLQIKKAFQLQPKEHRYASFYYEIRLKLNDKSSIDEELKYFENDIDSLVHTGRIYKLVNYLTRKKEYAKAWQIIQFINISLDELIDGRKQNKIFNKQIKDWYIYKKEEFNKKMEKTKNRLELLIRS